MHFELHSEFCSRCVMTVYVVSVATVCHVMCNARPNFNLHAILSSNTWALFQHSNHQPGSLSQCVPVVGVCLAEFEIFVQCVFIPQEWAPRTPCTGTEYMILYSLKMNWSNAEWCWKCFEKSCHEQWSFKPCFEFDQSWAFQKSSQRQNFF